MKKVLAAVMLTLVTFSMAAAEPFVAAEGVSISSAGPKIVVAEPSYYFGEVGPDTKLKHTFVLRNEGVEDLVIYKVSPP